MTPLTQEPGYHEMKSKMARFLLKVNARARLRTETPCARCVAEAAINHYDPIPEPFDYEPAAYLEGFLILEMNCA